MIKINYSELDYQYEQGLYYYAGRPFTGVAYEYHEDDSIGSEVHFVEGLMDGTSRSWYPSGNLEYEYHLKKGGQHGTNTEWFESGRIKKESIAEFGIVLQRKVWNDKGELVEEFQIEEDDPLYRVLLMRREKWNKEK